MRLLSFQHTTPTTFVVLYELDGEENEQSYLDAGKVDAALTERFGIIQREGDPNGVTTMGTQITISLTRPLTDDECSWFEQWLVSYFERAL